MRAAVLHGREDVRVEDVPLPEPGPGEIRLRVGAALTCGTDVKVYRRGYHARMIVPPALFGHEVAGTVEAVGEGVTTVVTGDRVVAANSAPCGACFFCAEGQQSLCDDLLFWNGAYAEMALIPARIVAQNLVRLPADAPFREAAMSEPLACVVRGVDESGIRAGQSVAIIGTGPIGLMFLTLARLRGATVTVAGRNLGRLAQAEAFGASTIVSGDDGDLAEALRAASPHGRGHDVVVEAAGQASTAEAAIRAVRKGGLVQLFAGCAAGTVIGLDAGLVHYSELTIKATFHHTPAAFRAALALLARRDVDARAFVTAEAALGDVPSVLAELARGGGPLKTAILPNG